MKPKLRVNKFEDASSEPATIGTSTTVEEHVNQFDATIQKHSIYDIKYDSDYEDFDVICLAVFSDSDSLREVEPVNMHFHFGNNEIKALEDSGGGAFSLL